MTQAPTSAFNLHSDDHSFLIAQLYGHKRWVHDPDLDETPREIVYSPGDVAFYPRGTLHDVTGLGELSVHLMIAFEGYRGTPHEEHPADFLGADQLRHIGTGLPYSLNPEAVQEDTAARLALRHTRSWNIRNDGKFDIHTGSSTIRLDKLFRPPLEAMAKTSSMTPFEVSSLGILPLPDALAFFRLGFVHGLLLTAARSRL
ncbi:hypothetical protein [Austwickia chelonae]|uniref:hypothetical protein n=1 Tax=Austwickia chelonae TaxID=100225 RepID=UPI0013C34485|nr:hypothetical protein [Austwickia chelonae]